MIIPKIFHQIWLGPNPLPDRFKKYSDTWLVNHLDWDSILWTDENLPELENQDLYNKARTYSEKSDILRFEILYQMGGVYHDTDYECYKNIEPIINPVDFFICKDKDLWSEKPPYNIPYLNGAFMGCTQGHPVMKKLIDNLSDFISSHRDDHVCMRTGPGFLSFMLKDEPIFIPPVVILNGIYARHHYTNSWQDIETQPENWPK